MIREIELQGRMIEYTLIRKKIKRINIRINDGEVHVSCPMHESVGNVEYVMRAKAAFIVAATERTRISSQKQLFPIEYTDGEQVMVWGKACRVKVEPLANDSRKGRVVFDYPTVRIQVKDVADRRERELVYERWKRAAVKGRLDELTRKYYDLMLPRIKERRGMPLKEVRYRQMKSKWGTCRPQRGLITFSYGLFACDPAAVEYVAVHELAHLIEANHSRRFYDEIIRVLPDYKEREILLKR